MGVALLIEAMEAKYKSIKKIVWTALISLMIVPTYFFGPLFWNDSSATGRWTFAADVEVYPFACRGLVSVFEVCELKFVTQSNYKMVKIYYAVIGTDWSGVTTDVVRSSTGHFTSAIAVTGSGLFARASVFAAMLIVAFGIHWSIMRLTLRALLRKMAKLEPPPTKKKTITLSRDRRDQR